MSVYIIIMQSRSPNPRSPAHRQYNLSINSPKHSPSKLSQREPITQPKPNRTAGETRKLCEISITSEKQTLVRQSKSPAQAQDSQRTLQSRPTPSPLNLQPQPPSCKPIIAPNQSRRSPKLTEQPPFQSTPIPHSPRKPSLTALKPTTYSETNKQQSALQTTLTSSIDADLEYTTNTLLQDCLLRKSPHTKSAVFRKKPTGYEEIGTTRTIREERIEEVVGNRRSPSKNRERDFRQTCLGKQVAHTEKILSEVEKRKRSFDLSLSHQQQQQSDFKEARLGDFSFGKCIGSGKFGQVYLAKHKKTGFLVAIKKICKVTIKQYKMQKQIIQQIKLQAFCINPNILQLYGYFHDQLHIYLILEFASDSTLFNYLHKHSSKLSERQTASIVREVVFAVQFLHQHDIAHRDIKPENILLSSGIAKLCDFGWSARVLEGRKSYCGTFDYTPPEILERKEYDESVDLWCLGVLIYQLLTGKVPFSSNDRKIAINKIINVDKEKITYPCELSASARNIIEGLLRKNPKQRLKPKQILEHEFFRVVKKQRTL